MHEKQRKEIVTAGLKGYETKRRRAKTTRRCTERGSLRWQTE